jgi:hypothetical protein
MLWNEDQQVAMVAMDRDENRVRDRAGCAAEVRSSPQSEEVYAASTLRLPRARVDAQSGPLRHCRAAGVAWVKRES